MTGEEAVDLVDGRDDVVGSSNVDECLAKGLLHRAVAVVLVRRDGRAVLQQRSFTDRWHPGRWTLSSTGHVKSGETYEEAARRELLEELGIDSEVKFVTKVLVPPVTEGSLTEREWVSIFEARSDEVCKIDSTELNGVAEVSRTDLLNLLSGGSLTPDSLLLFKEYLASTGR